MSWMTDSDAVVVYGPVQAQKGVRCSIGFVEPTVWTNKLDGKEYAAMKLTLNIQDDTVQTESPEIKPRLTIEDNFNLDRYPYLDKKGNQQLMGRGKLHQLEEAFGFDPIYKVGEEVVEPFMTKMGKKVAPRLENVRREKNPDFLAAYFEPEGSPKMSAWIDKEVYVDLGIELSEQYGDKNTVLRYVSAPTL